MKRDMVLSKHLAKEVLDWSKKRPRQEAIIELMQLGFSTRFCEQLLAGTYPHKFKSGTFDKLKAFVNNDFKRKVVEPKPAQETILSLPSGL